MYLKYYQIDTDFLTLPFQTTPVPNSVLEADQVVGFTPLQIEASHRSFEVEAKVYAKTPQKVKDWDENELADIAPREARLVKDSVIAIETTDKNNFELDDEDMGVFKILCQHPVAPKIVS